MALGPRRPRTRPEKDSRIVLTLDAGGTHLDFSAIRANEEIADPVRLPSEPDDLDRCLAAIVEGFETVRSRLKKAPAAISFAFPGPADYPRGIIGDPQNLPAFRGGVALGPMLEDRFKMPVFINNDGDLFAYGEAIAGLLPAVNSRLERAGSPRRFSNLLGVTLGTGFGAGLVHEGRLFIGDNAAAAEIWAMRNKRFPRFPAEESVSIRGVRMEYARAAGVPFENAPEPKRLFEIARGEAEGNAPAARAAFEAMGEALGDALANAVTLIDGLVAVGGGLSGAAALYMPALIREMNGKLERMSGGTVDRMELKAYDLDEAVQFGAFLKGDVRTITVPGTRKTLPYDPLKRIGVGQSVLGTTRAVSVGAYAFALSALD
jgi:glucokinase